MFVNLIRNHSVLLLMVICPAALLAGRATPHSSIKVESGFRVELLHSALEAEGSWISMTFDNRGRLIVGRDDVGLARICLQDQSTIDYELINESLRHCRGVLFAHDSLYVSATDSKGIYRIRDADGDDHFDEIKLLKKMDYRSRYGHGPNQLVLGPNGMIYLANGNDVSFPEGTSGDSPYRDPRHDWLLPNVHDLGHDNRVGHILRFDPDGQHWEVIAGGFRNQFDMVFNVDGELFTYDADMEWDVGLPWYRPTRLNHVVSGGEYGWRWGSGKWPTYYPDSLPTTLDTGRGSPTGMVSVAGSRFPAKYQESLLMADWQNGRIMVVRLTPSGASYTGEYEVFLEGAPLNVCDMEFGVDGALYFITGGRRSQSGLYRVTYVGDGTERPSLGPIENLSFLESKRDRQLRRQLENYHVVRERSAIDFLWPYLGDDDRWIRYAARLALERQEVNWWKLRALAEKDVSCQLNALLALARVGPTNVQKDLFAAMSHLTWENLEVDSILEMLRIYAISFIRHASLDPATRSDLAIKLGSRFPHRDVRVNQELGELLVYIDTPDVVEKILTRMEHAPSQQEQVHHALGLLHVEREWTSEHRQRLLSWLVRAQDFYGGKTVNATIDFIRDNFLETLEEDQRTDWQKILSRTVNPSDDKLSTEFRKIVRHWQPKDLQSELDDLGKSQRSLANGRQAMTAVHCLKCHRVGHEGTPVGPDLTDVGRRYDAHKIWESMVDPSKNVDPKYRQMTYFLDTGLVVTGRALHVSGQKLVIETNPLTAEQFAFPRESIESATSSRVSPMPAGLMDTLTRAEILDLVAYLISLSSREVSAAAKVNP